MVLGRWLVDGDGSELDGVLGSGEGDGKLYFCLEVYFVHVVLGQEGEQFIEVLLVLEEGRLLHQFPPVHIDH